MITNTHLQEHLKVKTHFFVIRDRTDMLVRAAAIERASE